MDKITTLYLLGTFHSGKKSKGALNNIFSQYKFNAILVEGIIDHKTQLFRKEPFLIWMLKLWFWYLNKKGSEFTLTYKLAKNLNIPVINIDKSLNELIELFHRPYYTLIFIMYIILMIYTSHNLMTFILYFIMAELIYFLYFTLIIGIKLRDEIFIKRISEIIEVGLYDNILVVCGKVHAYSIKKNFINKGVVVIDLINRI
ncbi:MAG: hypothetical protein WA144_13555 [Candidatus Methanoperedens sp.]